MKQRSQVPKLGTLESEENYIDKARKGKTDVKMNFNNPEDTPGMFSNNTTPVQAPSFQQEAEPKEQKGPEAARSKHERRISREDVELRGLTNSPLRPDTIIQRATGSSKSESEAPKGPDASRPRHERRLSREENDPRLPTDSPLRRDALGRRATVDSPHHRLGGISTSDSPKRVLRQSVGSDRSIEQSPLHPHHQARVTNKGSGVSSPSWERKGSSEGSHGLDSSTPGRSRLRSVTRGDETPDQGPAVPKFGDWDENDAAAAEGYTHIFNKVREEKQSAGKVPIITTESYYSNAQNRYGNDNSKGCLCFRWGRK